MLIFLVMNQFSSRSANRIALVISAYWVALLPYAFRMSYNVTITISQFISATREGECRLSCAYVYRFVPFGIRKWRLQPI